MICIDSMRKVNAKVFLLVAFQSEFISNSNRILQNHITYFEYLIADTKNDMNSFNSTTKSYLLNSIISNSELVSDIFMR